MLGGIKNSTGHGPGQPAVPDPALSRVLDNALSRGVLPPQPVWDCVVL